MNITELFDKRKDNPLFNTSYPLAPADWAQYRTNAPLAFRREKRLSFYIHIPFCRQLCSFCEYTRMKCPGDDSQHQYIDTIERDVGSFVAEHPGMTLAGFDIGGGTPTALSDSVFARLMDIFKAATGSLKTDNGFELSIEATFNTITPLKARLVAGAGIRRVSLGVQSASGEVLHRNHRQDTSAEMMGDSIAMLHGEGIEKVNLDMMYGLKGQTLDSLDTDLLTISRLHPEQVTLYELRTNMIKEDSHMDKDELYRAYSILFDGLTAMGYHADWGGNTFSLSSKDKGVSSYLRDRMLHGGSYKGFGISAQSMSTEGVAYNVGKSHNDIRELIGLSSYGEEFTYLLPPAELASKYIAIGAYNGSFSMNRLSEILGCDAEDHYREQLDMCRANGLLAASANDPDRLVITRKGFKHYGAVFSLFYSPERQRR